MVSPLPSPFKIKEGGKVLKQEVRATRGTHSPQVVFGLQSFE
ncbi:unnamed protein product [Spirodela intermedia]|uniref:Uncharacterized protein n=1 Tax=Spirodela intermedia TaxID=51605 RepID=A0A7I8K2P4_SPIIN|nr:unnamed protein product [Spirodela intermedia]